MFALEWFTYSLAAGFIIGYSIHLLRGDVRPSAWFQGGEDDE